MSLGLLARQLQTVSAEAAAKYQSESLEGMSKKHKAVKEKKEPWEHKRGWDHNRSKHRYSIEFKD